MTDCSCGRLKEWAESGIVTSQNLFMSFWRQTSNRTSNLPNSKDLDSGAGIHWGRWGWQVKRTAPLRPAAKLATTQLSKRSLCLRTLGFCTKVMKSWSRFMLEWGQVRHNLPSLFNLDTLSRCWGAFWARNLGADETCQNDQHGESIHNASAQLPDKCPPICRSVFD